MQWSGFTKWSQLTFFGQKKTHEENDFDNRETLESRIIHIENSSSDDFQLAIELLDFPMFTTFASHSIKNLHVLNCFASFFYFFCIFFIILFKWIHLLKHKRSKRELLLIFSLFSTWMFVTVTMLFHNDKSLGYWRKCKQKTKNSNNTEQQNTQSR